MINYTYDSSLDAGDIAYIITFIAIEDKQFDISVKEKKSVSRVHYSVGLNKTTL